MRTLGGGSSYLSASQLRAHFGLGGARTYDGVVVRWPDGLLEEFAGGEADRLVVVERGQGSKS